MDNYKRPSKKSAEDAVRVLLDYLGDNSKRNGLTNTPKRVINSYSEFFQGYRQNAKMVPSKNFDNVTMSNNIILLKNITLESYCEHYMVPIIGVVHIAYLPKKNILGISKIARAVNIFAKRLQTQERLTTQIANLIEYSIQPKGFTVIINALHHCIAYRGVKKAQTSTITSCVRGTFNKDDSIRHQAMSLIHN